MITKMMFVLFLLLSINLLYSAHGQQYCKCNQLDQCVTQKQLDKEEQLQTCRDSCRSQLSNGNTAECYEIRDRENKRTKDAMKQCMDSSNLKPCSQSRKRRQGLPFQFPSFGDLISGLFSGSGLNFGNFDWNQLGGGSGGLGELFGGALGGGAGGGGGNNLFGGDSGDGSNGNGGDSGQPPFPGGDDGNNNNQGFQGSSNGGGFSQQQQSSISNSGQQSSGKSSDRYRRIGLELSGAAATDIDKYEQCIKDCAKNKERSKRQNNGGRQGWWSQNRNNGNNNRPSNDNQQQGGGGGRGAGGGSSGGRGSGKGGGLYGQCAASLNCDLNTQGFKDKASRSNCFKQSGMKDTLKTFCGCLQQAYSNGVSCTNVGNVQQSGGSSSNNRGSNNNNNGGARNSNWNSNSGNNGNGNQWFNRGNNPGK